MKKPGNGMDKTGKLEVSGAGELVKLADADMPNLEIWLEDETFWLTQQQMGVLFGVKENTITYHIKEILASGELEGIPTTRNFRVVRLEGKRLTEAERSINTIVYTLTPALPANRPKMGFGQEEKGYADAYKGDKRPVTLVGINFRAAKRNIDEPVMGKVKG